MKKTLASILAIMALFGMASCQSNTKSERTATVTVADTTTAVETTTASTTAETTISESETTIVESETSVSETEEITELTIPAEMLELVKKQAPKKTKEDFSEDNIFNESDYSIESFYDDFNDDGTYEAFVAKEYLVEIGRSGVYYIELWYTDGTECTFVDSFSAMSWAFRTEAEGKRCLIFECLDFSDFIFKTEDTYVVTNAYVYVVTDTGEVKKCECGTEGYSFAMCSGESESKLVMVSNADYEVQIPVKWDGTNFVAAESTNEASPSATDESELYYDLIKNGKEFGNDKAGYISIYSDWEYTENESGEYTLISPDGIYKIETMIMSGISTDLNSTAKAFATTVAYNAEAEGFDTCSTAEIPNGYFSMMIDSDTDLGFRLYAAFPDEEAGVIRAVKAECSSFTLEELILLSEAFDTYHK